MAEREIGAVLVMTEDGLVAGIFTERDLLMRVVNAGLRPEEDADLDGDDARRALRDAGHHVEAAMALMHLNRHRHLLVIDGPKVHGLVSMRDLVYQIVRRGAGRFEAAAARQARHG